MRKYKYILFDLDGTLIQSHPGIFSCMRHALAKMGCPEPAEEVLRKCVGPTLVYSFSHFFGMSQADAEKATAIYRQQYSKTGVYENQPFEGAVETLKILKEQGYVLALATSKPQVFADMITDRFGMSEQFTVRVGCGLDGSLPTKASVIAEAVKRLGAEKEDCLMVGDRRQDAAGAKEVGVDCALLKLGYAEDGEIEEAEPSFVFNDFADLTAFLTE
ncbi:MAG: HAD hydrolase-like protein [Clostridia bacterium]|nr:HAD hydrolase-like protein [Clostridia bacterium]